MTAEVKNVMAGGEETARRAGVYPGEIHDLQKGYRLEWDGWDGFQLPVASFQRMVSTW
jgi:hypothetical protein